MTKTVQTTSTEGYSSTSEIGEYTLEIDATGEQTQDTLETLLASYAACYVPALRVGAQQRDAGELGEITIEVTGELNDDDKLAAVQFDVDTEADLDEETAEEVVGRAEQLCKVHDALKSDLHADASLS
jgi:uncharacterized OsmC-like protein